MKWTKLGEAPDYRFTLANERTFLAWIRTAIALLAAAVALDQLAPNLAVPWVRNLISLALCIFSGLSAGHAYLRWANNEKAIRLKQNLPYSPLLRILSIFLVLMAGIILGLLIYGG
ncbi:YidH family protein [Gynuella sp.]|uniref:YidH family protein n=1 Tax=Gynuella sp. TaxID=2969146 RepID=UPI003D0E47A2